MSKEESKYTDDLRIVKSLLIVTSLQKKRDLKATGVVRRYSKPLIWGKRSELLIAEAVWKYAVENQKYDPKLVFCHPDVLIAQPSTSLYYRGLCGLSLKAAKDYVGAVESIESGSYRGKLSPEKALKMARVYNTFICSIISSSTRWTLRNVARTLIATLGISLDGTMRNKIGEIAEERVRSLIVEWLEDKGLLQSDASGTSDERSTPRILLLAKNVQMRFASEPDISFSINGQLVAVVEIKGGIDPAGTLERYGAATKSFQHAGTLSPRCKNFYLAAC